MPFDGDTKQFEARVAEPKPPTDPVLLVLIDAREKVRQGWVNGYDEFDIDGDKKYCIRGAVQAASRSYAKAVYRRAYRVVTWAGLPWYFPIRCPTVYNDGFRRANRQDKAIAVFDRAIAYRRWRIGVA